MQTFLYKNLFIYASLQFSGNMEEYFVQHTEKLVVFILASPDNIARLYIRGKLVEEKKLKSFENKILYYASWYAEQLYLILHYFSYHEKLTLIGGHPLLFFGMSMQKLFRKISYIYMIGDYFPSINFPLWLFQMFKSYYHRKIPYAFYLSDEVNQMMNGRVLATNNRKTIMWGVHPRPIIHDIKKARQRMLFVGLVKEGQGIELALSFLQQHKEYFLKIIGVSHEGYYDKYQRIIHQLGIEKQVYYPNRFMPEKELDDESQDCFVGIAPYTLGKTNTSYYADAGKIKAYAEMGLPVVISNTTAIARFVKKFHSGIVMPQWNVSSFYEVLQEVEKRYAYYKNGLKEFNNYFYYDTYYTDRFATYKPLNQ